MLRLLFQGSYFEFNHRFLVCCGLSVTPFKSPFVIVLVLCTLHEAYVKIRDIFYFSDAILSFSARSKPILTMAGYRYCRKRNTQTKTIWQCATHVGKGCRALIHTVLNENVILRCKNIHNHYFNENLQGFTYSSLGSIKKQL